MNTHILCIYWGLRVYPKKVNIQNTSTYYSDEGNGILLQYSWLENPMDREDWQATYSPLGYKSRTWLRH